MLLRLRKILWTAKKTNEWSKDTVKARKLAHCGHTMRKQGSSLDKKYNAKNAGEEGRTLDNLKTTLRGRVIRMTEDSDK